MEHLAGRSRKGPVRAVGAIVALLAVLGLVRLIVGGTDHGTRNGLFGAMTAGPSRTGSARTPSRSAAPRLSSTALLLPVAGCGDVAELQLHGPVIDLHAASQPADPLADLLLTGCGGPGQVVVTPEGDALLGEADVSAAASYTECAESIREGPVRRLVIAVGTTFCATQRAETVERFGGQAMARVTVTGIDAYGAFVLAIGDWPV